MKLILGAAVLLALFALALALQRHWRSEALADRQQARLEREASENAGGTAAEPGWARVVVGGPAGAEPVPAVEPAPAPRPAPPAEVPVPAAPREFELDVAPGQTLSTICKEHYKTARVEVVQALARYNGLAEANAVRAGQKLRLPTLEVLLAKKP